MPLRIAGASFSFCLRTWSVLTRQPVPRAVPPLRQTLGACQGFQIPFTLLFLIELFAGNAMPLRHFGFVCAELVRAGAEAFF